VRHYFNPMSRAVTSDWMLKELDAAHERIVIDIQAGEQDSPEYRAINPMGKVPTLVDGDAVVTEAAAICAYLADKFAEKGLAPSPGSPERGRYYRYLFFPGATLEPLLSVTALGIEDIRPHTMGWGDMPRAMAAVESMTPDTDWALGARFTAADVVVGGTLAFFCGFNMMTASPKVANYVERIGSRAAFRETHLGF